MRPLTSSRPDACAFIAVRCGYDDAMPNVSLPPLHASTEREGDVPNADVPEKKLGVAVVGLGHLALENIIPGFAEAKHVRLAALVSGDRAKASAIAAQHGLAAQYIYDYATFDRIRDDPAVDIVYIVLPNSMHAEYTVRAAATGKHVLCEKPMATSVAECRAMIAACERAQRKLMIAYRLQYEAGNRQIIALARSKQFGDIRFMDAVNSQNDAANGQWRQMKALSGGGSLPDVGLYCLNAFRYITGEEPVEVTGNVTRPAGDPRFREIEDIAHFTMRFPSGIFASATSGYSFHENRRFRVHATDAWFGMDPAFGYDGQTVQIGRKAGTMNSIEEQRGTPKSQFATEMDAFALSIRQDLVPHTPGEEGLADQIVMEAIYASAASGTPVTLTPPPGADLDVTRGPFPG